MIKTTYQWATPLSVGLVLTCAVVAALVFAVLRRAAGGPLGPSKRWGIWLLRGGIVALLIVILLNPVRVEETPGAVERPRVVYLLDTSQSMALGQTDHTRWDEALATIRGAEAASQGTISPEVGVFRFGDRLAAVKSLFWRAPAPDQAPAAHPEPPPAPTDSDTLMSSSLEALAGRFGQSLPRAVVLFSDGQARDSERVPAIARGFQRMDVPIHVVPVGNANVGGDVAIVSMVAPNLVRKSTRVPVQLFVRSYGYKGQRAEVKLTAVEPDGSPGAILGRVPVVLQDGLASYSLSFESGERDRRISATVDPQPGEVSTTNNTFAADVAIDHTKIRVLYVEGINERTIARRGLFGLGQGEVQGAYTPLQKALMDDPDIECTVVVPAGPEGNFGSIARTDDSGRGLPETLSELFAYDAIILSNVPSEVLSPKYMGWVDEWVGRRGGGLCMVGGPNSFASGRWAETPVGRMLPVGVESAGRDWDQSAARLQPVADRTTHPLWHIVADDAANHALLASLPGFLGRNRFGPAKPTAEVLATVSAGSPDAGPALAVQPYGRGRTMALATGITRRFGPDAQSWGQGDNRYYRKFWRNAVYWLTENSSIGRRRLLAETDKRLYRPGESIILKARAFDEDAAPTVAYRVAVSVEPRSATDTTADNSPLHKPTVGPTPEDDRAPLLPWGEEFDLAKLATDQSYTVRLPIADGKNLPSGVSLTQGLRIELTAYENNTQVDSTAIDVQVLDDPSEQQNPLPDHALLRRIATESGGKVLQNSTDLAAMLGRLPAAIGPPEIKSMPAWSRPWLLTVLITLLTIEWAWRRWLGLA